MSKILMVLGFIGLFLFSSCGVSQTAKSAPDFSLMDLQGNKISISSLKGKVIVLNFWASWCPPCKAEIPDFVKIYQTYKDKGLVIIGVAVNSKTDDVKEIVKKYSISYPVAMDDGSAEKAYGPVTAVPTTFIIDKQGNLVPGGKKVGRLSEEALLKIIEPLLK